MRQVIPLHLCHVLRQPRVVKRVVHAVVEHVEGERPADDPIGNSLGEDGVRELGEWRFEDEEQKRGHDESESVHGEVVVDPMKEEVKEHRPVGIGKVVVDVKEESVKGVFEDRPDDVAGEEAEESRGDSGWSRGGERSQAGWREGQKLASGDGRVGELQHRQRKEERGDRSPHRRHHIPLRPCKALRRWISLSSALSTSSDVT